MAAGAAVALGFFLPFHEALRQSVPALHGRCLATLTTLGTLTAIFLAIPRNTRASAIMPSNSVAATSDGEGVVDLRGEWTVRQEVAAP